LGSIVGTVRKVEGNGFPRPVPGATVGLYDGEGAKVKSSVTASDGSFHLGEVKPGLYWVQVEGQSLPKHLAPKTPPQKVRVVSGLEAPVDQDVHFLVAPAEPVETKVPEPPVTGAIPGAPQGGSTVTIGVTSR